jgi:hypothetical protein
MCPERRERQAMGETAGGRFSLSLSISLSLFLSLSLSISLSSHPITPTQTDVRTRIGPLRVALHPFLRPSVRPSVHSSLTRSQMHARARTHLGRAAVGPRPAYVPPPPHTHSSPPPHAHTPTITTHTTTQAPSLLASSHPCIPAHGGPLPLAPQSVPSCSLLCRAR